MSEVIFTDGPFLNLRRFALQYQRFEREFGSRCSKETNKTLTETGCALYARKRKTFRTIDTFFRVSRGENGENTAMRLVGFAREILFLSLEFDVQVKTGGHAETDNVTPFK